MTQIVSVDVGTVIPTGIPKESRVILRAGAQERVIGHPGRVNGNLAVRIVDSVQVAPSVPESRSNHT